MRSCCCWRFLKCAKRDLAEQSRAKWYIRKNTDTHTYGFAHTKNERYIYYCFFALSRNESVFYRFCVDYYISFVLLQCHRRSSYKRNEIEWTKKKATTKKFPKWYLWLLFNFQYYRKLLVEMYNLFCRIILSLCLFVRCLSIESSSTQVSEFFPRLVCTKVFFFSFYFIMNKEVDWLLHWWFDLICVFFVCVFWNLE